MTIEFRDRGNPAAVRPTVNRDRSQRNGACEPTIAEFRSPIEEDDKGGPSGNIQSQ